MALKESCLCCKRDCECSACKDKDKIQEKNQAAVLGKEADSKNAQTENGMEIKCKANESRKKRK